MKLAPLFSHRLRLLVGRFFTLAKTLLYWVPGVATVRLYWWNELPRSEARYWVEWLFVTLLGALIGTSLSIWLLNPILLRLLRLR